MKSETLQLRIGCSELEWAKLSDAIGGTATDAILNQSGCEETKHQDSFAIKVWEGGFFLKKRMLQQHAVPSTC